MDKGAGMRTLLAAASVAVLCLLLVACGGSDDPSDGEVPAPSRAETAASGATTTAEPTLDESADAYLTLVAPLNDAVREVNRDLQGVRSFSEALDPVKRVREAQQAFEDGLLRIRFPGSVQPQVDDVVAAAGASKGETDALIASIEDGTATRTDLSAWGASLQTLAARAAVLRNALGLPQVN